MIERFAPGLGGVENVAWQVAHELVRSGEDVTVVARETAGDGAVPVERVPASSRWQPWRVVAFDRGAARRTGPAAGARFDVVHGFSRTRRQDLYRAGGGRHADYLRRTHGPVGRALRALSPRHRILIAFERAVFADERQRVQCPSRLVADRIVSQEGVAPSRIFLLPNGVDVDRFTDERHDAAGRRLRAELDPDPSEGPLWLLAASGWRRKGLAELLTALSDERLRGHRLWIAGRDDPRPWRRRLARLGLAERVRFLGERDDLEVVYHAVDGLVLPTRYDAFANVTLEAAAAGLPIVTTRTNGAAEWLGEDVRLIEGDGHPGELVRALGELEAADHRHALGERLARRARTLDWARHVEALRTEYARIAADRRTGAKP